MSIPDPFDAPESAAETLPNPRRHALETTDYRIHALCARHDITVEGIVALVDEVMDEAKFHNVTHGSLLLRLRRLARGEQA